MSESRSSILGALRRGRSNTPTIGAYILPTASDRQLYSDFPQRSELLLPLFAERFAALSGELHVCSSLAAAVQTLKAIILATPGRHCATQRCPVVAALRRQDAELDRLLVDFDAQAMNSRALSNVDVGVTAADYLVARTGSIALSTASAGGRQLSVLPPIHIVIATTAQLVASVEQAMPALTGGGSFGTLISGPSRTADIEKILVLGAHGPKRLIALLVDASVAPISKE